MDKLKLQRDRSTITGMFLLPRDNNIYMRCTSVERDKTFINDAGEEVHFTKVKFVPEDFSFGEISFTALLNLAPDYFSLLNSEVEQGKSYVLGCDVSSKGKVSIVDIVKAV